MLLERMVAAAAAAPGNATNTVVIRGRKVSRREVQQEMRWWQWAYGDKKASLLLCPLGGRPQTRAVPSSDNHTSLDWSGQNHQLIQLLIVFTAVVCMCQDTQPRLLLIKV